MPPPDWTRIARVLVAAAVAAALAGIPLAWARAIRRRRRGLAVFGGGAGPAVPWGAGTVVAVALTYIGLNLTLGASAGVLLRGAGLEFGPTLQMLFVAVLNLMILMAIPRLLAATSGATPADLGLSRATLDRRLGDGAAAGLMILPVVYGINFAALRIWSPKAHPLQEMLARDPSWATVALAVVSAVVLAPAAEELLFRGVLLGWLLRPRPPTPEVVPPVALDDPPGPATAAWLSSLGADPEAAGNPYHRSDDPDPDAIAGTGSAGEVPRLANAWVPNAVVSLGFALIHFGQWPAPVPIFVLSMGLGALYAKTGSVAATFAMHAVFNGMSTLAMILLILSADPKAKQEAGDVAPPAVVAGAGGLEGNPRFRADFPLSRESGASIISDPPTRTPIPRATDTEIPSSLRCRPADNMATRIAISVRRGLVGGRGGVSPRIARLGAAGHAVGAGDCGPRMRRNGASVVSNPGTGARNLGVRPR